MIGVFGFSSSSKCLVRISQLCERARIGIFSITSVVVDDLVSVLRRMASREATKSAHVVCRFQLSIKKAPVLGRDAIVSS